MFRQKSYILYNPFLSKTTKSNNQNQNRTFFFAPQQVNIKSDKSSESLSPKFKRIRSYKSFNKNSLDYKFYKLLKKSPKPKKNSNFFLPEIIDKSPFNFNLKDEEAEIIKKIKRINKGNKKHRLLSEMAFKKETEKRKNVKNFLNEMKLNRINIKLVEKQNLEEKKKKLTQMLNLQMKKKKKIKKITSISFDSIYKGSKSTTNKNSFVTINNLFDNERKLVLRRDKLMHRFHEIMNKLNSNTQNAQNSQN